MRRDPDPKREDNHPSLAERMWRRRQAIAARLLAEAALADLARVTGLRGSPVETRVTRWTDGLPQYAVGHAARVEHVRSAVGGHPGLGVCGAAYGGVGIPACIADAGREAERLADALTDHDHTDRGASGAAGPNQPGPKQQGVNP